MRFPATQLLCPCIHFCRKSLNAAVPVGLSQCIGRIVSGFQKQSVHQLTHRHLLSGHQVHGGPAHGGRFFGNRHFLIQIHGLRNHQRRHQFGGAPRLYPLVGVFRIQHLIGSHAVQRCRLGINHRSSCIFMHCRRCCGRPACKEHQCGQQDCNISSDSLQTKNNLHLSIPRFRTSYGSITVSAPGSTRTFISPVSRISPSATYFIRP